VKQGGEEELLWYLGMDGEKRSASGRQSKKYKDGSDISN